LDKSSEGRNVGAFRQCGTRHTRSFFPGDSAESTGDKPYG
jgi:hypothetical protein